MALVRWDPFGEIRRMNADASRLLRSRENGGWTLPVDVVQSGDGFLVRASLPGVKPEDIGVSIQDGLLSIEAKAEAQEEEQDGSYLVRERRSGRFQRTLRLPETVDLDHVKSQFENGVLIVNLPKAEAEKAKRVEVEVA